MQSGIINKDIISFKTTLMGLSMFMVILCHTPNVGLKLLRVFPAGLIGTDVFIFLSGYSLCYAIGKYPLKTFYFRRIVRIYPMFFILAVFMSLLNIYNGESIGIIDWLSNLSFASFYVGGAGFAIDWYLSICVLLYLLFPLLYKHMNLKLLIILTVLSFLFQIAYSFNFLGIEMIGDVRAAGYARVPMFCWGIFLYKEIITNGGNGGFDKIWIYLFWIAILLLSIFLKLHFFWLTDLIAPFLIVVLLLLCKKIICYSNVRRYIDVLGKYSIEIYIANFIATKVCALLPHNYLLLLIYAVLTYMMTLVFIPYNRIIMRYMSKII